MAAIIVNVEAIIGNLQSIPRPNFFTQMPIIIPCNKENHGKNLSKIIDMKTQRIFIITSAMNALIIADEIDCSLITSSAST